jgi:hypothetical protein
MPAHSFKLHCIEGRLDKLLDGLFVLGVSLAELREKYPVYKGIHVEKPVSFGGIQAKAYASFQTLFPGNVTGKIYRTADYQKCVIASSDLGSPGNYNAYTCTSGNNEIKAFFDACSENDNQSIIIDDVNDSSFSLKTYFLSPGEQYQLLFDKNLI